MNRIVLLVLFITAFFVQCETNWGKYGGYKIDSYSALDYYLKLNKYDTLAITKGDSRKNISPYPGVFIRYHKPDNSVDTLFTTYQTPVIDPFVKGVEFDSTFILVSRIPVEKVCECDLTCLMKKYEGDVWNKPTYELCKEALENTTLRDFWIINKLTDDVYGPYSLEEYFSMRKKLNVPESLQLDLENEHY